MRLPPPLTLTFTYNQVSILQTATFFGRMIPQLSIPFIGLFNLQLLCLISVTVLLFAFVAVKTIAGTVIFAILYGFFSGASKSPLLSHNAGLF